MWMKQPERLARPSARGLSPGALRLSSTVAVERLASARRRCYTGGAVCTPAGEVAPWPQVRRRGAEGATAPETLRQKDCGGKGALESGGRALKAWPHTEGVSRGPLARMR